MPVPERMRQMIFRRLFSVLFSLLALSLGGCGKDAGIATVGDSQTECADSQAVIAVYDGFYQNLCGCTESAGQKIYGPETLECTIPKGTTVFFTYLSPSAAAQIISIGTPSFVSGNPYHPEKKDSTRSYARTFDDVGTYQFTNAFNSVMNGELIVY